MTRAFRPSRGERVDKPWGYEIIWARTEKYVGKILHIEAGHALSLQYHRVKDETLCLLSGRLQLEIGESETTLQVIELAPGERVHIEPNVRHRMTALETCDVLEASTTELDDVVRLSDRYGRVPRSK